MRCPVCNHENTDLATRCSACGSILPDNEQPSPTPTQDTTEEQMVVSDTEPLSSPEPLLSPEPLPSPEQTTESTAEHPQPFIDPNLEPLGEDPNLREETAATEKRASSRGHRLAQFVSKHQRMLGIGLALGVIVVLAAVWLVLNIVDAPTYNKIEGDLAQLMPTYEYAGGAYGPDLQIPLSSVSVTKREGTKTPEGMEVGEGVGSAAYGVDAEAIYDDGKIRAARNVEALYVRNEGEWTVTGDLAERDTTFTARSGVDEQKVLDNVYTILGEAKSDNGASLADIYADGQFSIVGNAFKEAGNKDTATNDVTLHCSKESGFFAYEGNVVAHFAFEAGTWVLRNAQADGSAALRTYTPLVGTWSGELASSSSNGATCYGAQGNAIQVAIDSVGEPSASRAKVSGTISVLAHYHNKLEAEANTFEGDTMLERVPFTGTIQTKRDDQAGGNLTVECTTAGSSQGDISFVLNFGSNDDPSAVSARVTCTHTYEETVFLFIPHQTTAKFEDTYALRRAG